MTNGEKFKQTFGFDVDESKVIAVNPKWWDCEFQNSKPITKRVSPADMQVNELVETIRKQCYYMDCGNCNTCVKLKAADIIEAQDRHILMLQHEMMTEAESHIAEVNRLNKQIEILSKMKNVTD